MAVKPLPVIGQVETTSGDACCADDDCCSTTAATTDAGPLPTVSADARRTVVKVDGMDCASCAMTLERVVRDVDGIERAVVNFAAARLDVHHGDAVDLAIIEAAVERAGFHVHAPNVGPRIAWWRQRGVAAMLLAAAMFTAGFVGSILEPDLPWEALFAAAIVIGGRPIFRSALVAMRARHLDMNVLMAAATIGAAIIGEWPEAAAIVLLFSLGNTLQVHAVARTRAAVARLGDLAPDEVRVRRGAALVDQPVASVEAGAQIVVRPGERIAFDGVIVEGSTTIDESPITGESVPVEKAVGDRVLSGSLNGTAAITMTVERIAAESTLQRIVELVEQAQATKAPAELFVDRFARIYTPIVVLAAVALMVIPPLFDGAWSTWAYRGLALLIIACPCSLVISTPVTVVSAIGAASRRGILVKGGDALERAGHMRALAIDKTGTLTEGRPTLVATNALGAIDADDCLRLAAAIERRSEHPLAHAIVSAAGTTSLPQAAEVVAIPGRGATALIDGAEYVVGSPRLFAERGIEVGETGTALLGELAERGETPVLFGTATEALAVFGLADTIRPDARHALDELRRQGIDHIVMLTGDSEGAARRVARELGIDHRAGLLPEQKVDAVRELVATHGEVGMVGDGVNDAPALATASVSFAMGAAGSGVALEAADITLMADDLRSVAAATDLSRAARRVLRQNVVASLLFKGAFVLLAPFGFVTLWVAVAADMGTSLAVTANGLRLFRRHTH